MPFSFRPAARASVTASFAGMFFGARARSPLAALVTLVTLVALVGAAACGPSFKAMYEGDARFETCYALDESVEAKLAQKSACWAEWRKNYTYGQTRDRVEYATARYEALARGDALPTDEALMAAAPGAAHTSSMVSAPAPTSAFAPPPKFAPSADGGAPDGGVWRASSVSEAVAPKAAEASAPPAAGCTTGCTEAFSSCGEACTAKPCAACDRDYKKCMRGCFVEDKKRK